MRRSIVTGSAIVLLVMSGCVAQALVPQSSDDATHGELRGSCATVHWEGKAPTLPQEGVPIVVRSSSWTRRVVANARSDREGKFSISLPPGTYEVSATFSSGYLEMDNVAKATVVIEAGKSYPCILYRTRPGP